MINLDTLKVGDTVWCIVFSDEPVECEVKRINRNPDALDVQVKNGPGNLFCGVKDVFHTKEEWKRE